MQVCFPPSSEHESRHEVKVVYKCRVSKLIFSANITMCDLYNWQLIIIGLPLWWSAIQQLDAINTHQTTNVFAITHTHHCFGHQISLLMKLLSIVIDLTCQMEECNYTHNMWMNERNDWRHLKCNCALRIYTRRRHKQLITQNAANTHSVNIWIHMLHTLSTTYWQRTHTTHICLLMKSSNEGKLSWQHQSRQAHTRTLNIQNYTCSLLIHSMWCDDDVLMSCAGGEVCLQFERKSGWGGWLTSSTYNSRTESISSPPTIFGSEQRLRRRWSPPAKLNLWTTHLVRDTLTWWSTICHFKFKKKTEK